MYLALNWKMKQEAVGAMTKAIDKLLIYRVHVFIQGQVDEQVKDVVGMLLEKGTINEMTFVCGMSINFSIRNLLYKFKKFTVSEKYAFKKAVMRFMDELDVNVIPLDYTDNIYIK